MNDMSNTITGTELIQPEGRDLASIFATEGELDRVLDAISVTAKSQVQDTSTAKGRDAIRAMAMKVVHSKTALDAAAKTLSDEARAVVDGVNAKRRMVKDRLDGLRDEVRQPLDDWVRQEAERKARVQAQIDALRSMTPPPPDATPDQLRALIARVDAIDLMSFAGMIEIAQPLLDEAQTALADALEAAVKREAEAAELAALRVEKAAREQAERDRAEREEQIRKDAAERAAQAERDRQAAEADCKAREEAEAKRQAEVRANNARHRARIRREAFEAIVRFLIDEQHVAPLIEAIEAGKVPHVTIQF